MDLAGYIRRLQSPRDFAFQSIFRSKCTPKSFKSLHIYHSYPFSFSSPSTTSPSPTITNHNNAILHQSLDTGCHGTAHRISLSTNLQRPRRYVSSVLPNHDIAHCKTLTFDDKALGCYEAGTDDTVPCPCQLLGGTSLIRSLFPPPTHLFNLLCIYIHKQEISLRTARLTKSPITDLRTSPPSRLLQ